MALGNWKVGKQESRGIERRLAKHLELMKQFVSEGMTQEEASKKAYDIVISMKINGRK